MRFIAKIVKKGLSGNQKIKLRIWNQKKKSFRGKSFFALHDKTRKWNTHKLHWSKPAAVVVQHWCAQKYVNHKFCWDSWAKASGIIFGHLKSFYGSLLILCFFFFATHKFPNFKGIWWCRLCRLCCFWLFVFQLLEAWIWEGMSRRLMRLLNPTSHSWRHPWFLPTRLNDCSVHKLEKLFMLFSFSSLILQLVLEQE